MVVDWVSRRKESQRMLKMKLFRLAMLAGAGLLFVSGCGVSGLSNLLPWIVGAGIASTFLQTQGA